MLHLKKLILKNVFSIIHIYDAVGSVWSLFGFFSGFFFFKRICQETDLC